MLFRTKIKELSKWKDASPRKPLILKGARQVGKTSLLKDFGKNNFPKIHYFNFEEDAKLAPLFDQDLKPKRILDSLSLYQNKSISTEDLIIFDEIQECPAAITSLKYFCESYPEGFFAAAGSLLGLHFNSSFPVGKVSFVDLAPLNFEEFLLAVDESLLQKKLSSEGVNFDVTEPIHSRLWELLKNYFIVGGMPESVSYYVGSMDDPVAAYAGVRSIQKDLVTSYTNDIAKHSGKLSALNIERVWRSIPAQLSQNMDGSAKKYRFKDVIAGKKGFRDLSGPLAWITKAGIGLKIMVVNSALSPSNAYTKENRFKLMLHDIGILGTMAELTPKTILSWEFGTFKGYFVENYVAQELTSRGVDLYSWEEGTAEIEFLQAKDNYNRPIEVKAGRNVSKAKSLGVFQKKYQPQSSIIFSNNISDISDSKRFRLPLYLTSFFEL